MKLIKFPEGVMTELEYVLKHAGRVEAYKVTWESLYKRDKFNSMNGDQQKAYIASLRKRADKQLYRAWNGEGFFQISEKSYKAWLCKDLINKLEA